MSSSVHCAADVRALIPFSLKAWEQKVFSLKCFVVGSFFLLLLFFYHYDFTKGGRTGERVADERPPS